jgi:hypothetical protein
MNSTSSNATHPDPGDSVSSRCHVALLDGPSVTFWTCPGTAANALTEIHDVPGSVAELALCLAPERLIVVGRSTGRSPVPYLDPAYSATPILPDSGQSVLRGEEKGDIYVSRAHFTLRGAPGGGIVFTNGVPRVGGGLRPPKNGTKLMAPHRRWLEPGEEVFIGFGEAVAIRLPNRCVLQLRAQ